MGNLRKLGMEGESLAAQWLQEQGFTLLHKNWRSGRVEIDIVASKNNTLHIIEVKTRSGYLFGRPEEAVDKKKIQNMMLAADAYQVAYPEWKRIQFDILAITMMQESEPAYHFMEDIYL